MLKDDTNIPKLPSIIQNGNDHDEKSKSISKIVKDLRENAGLSFTDLQNKTGLSDSLLSAIESGDKKLTIKTARILINFYKPEKEIENKLRHYIRKENNYSFKNLENISVNDLIKNLRIDKLLNKTEVESLSGLSDSLIQAIESGEKELTARTFLKLLPIYEPKNRELDKISEFLQQKGENMTTILILCSKELKTKSPSGLSTK